jgi:YegS/Rv2252/BmrU family lipid kinase
LEILTTGARGDAERFAHGLNPAEWDVCVAAGGDGTINEVLNGLPEGLPLGVLPLGTANVLARELEIPLNDLPAAVDVLRTGTAKPMDLGWCNGRRFCLMAGIGWDAAAVRDVPPDVKHFLGAPAYVLSGLKALADLPGPLRYRITMADGVKVVKGMMLVVANTSNYAGDLKLAPEASVDSGTFDVCLFRETSRLGFIGQLFNVLQRKQMDDPRFMYFHADELTVSCHPPAAVQLDGDYFCRTPVTLRVLPGAVNVIRP